ncbi:YeeE/YedE thiosulfate transporter family protein [Maribellus maritimus]|uniref:YeeE/YedE thiosulfate transporter family protein n=1 Tax=Maribellus maritimus TaxID=2870838 RepID=UPI001EEBC7F7|nr:YeeE/YedE thiosulfate transporter family protein [Maribellus maritimus]MCG6186669.1 YeeE/YedE family protein [Maribellus maritimus]
MILTVFLGFIFGGILQYAKLNKFNTISGVATLSDLTVAKAIAMAVGLGAILLNVSIGMGWAGYHVKPFVVGGIILGGLIFGVGMAILGYCPGTLAISLGEGSTDALVGIIGGLFGGLIYTVLLPSIQGILGPDLGKISVNSIAGGNSAAFYAATVVLGLIFIGIAFGVHKIEKRPEKNMKWLLAGILLALLNTIVFSKGVSNRPIGASTTFPYVADWLSGFTSNSYFEKIQVPGNWEVFFLLGALLSGLILSLIRGEFKIQLIHENWVKYKNNSVVSRAIWAFIGGFVLIFGARMAGGCTSGHVISGGMQLAISSLVFAVFVFAGLLITGRVFYGKAK